MLFSNLLQAQTILLCSLLALSQSTGTTTSTSTSQNSTSSSSSSAALPTNSGTTINVTNLQVTALVGQDNVSAFQCWQIQPNFTISQQTGTVGAKIQSIGNISGATIVYFDSNNVTFAGLHPAPLPQWVVFLAGGGFVRLNSTDEILPIQTGDVLIANDTSEVSQVGHDSTWLPGTIAMQLPFANGQVNHTVVNSGPCNRMQFA